MSLLRLPAHDRRLGLQAIRGIERHKLAVTAGENNLMIFGDEDGNNTHCRVCGSLLYSVVREGAFVHVAMGTLVDNPTVRPTKHIFAGSKAPWFAITDDLPQYEGQCWLIPLDGTPYLAMRALACATEEMS